jgi:hypothetical protein
VSSDEDKDGNGHNNLREYFSEIKNKLISEIGMSETLAEKLPTKEDFVDYLVFGGLLVNHDYHDWEYGKQLITHFILNRAEIGSNNERGFSIEVNSNYGKILEEASKYLSKKYDIAHLNKVALDAFLKEHGKLNEANTKLRELERAGYNLSKNESGKPEKSKPGRGAKYKTEDETHVAIKSINGWETLSKERISEKLGLSKSWLRGFLRDKGWSFPSKD